jgi:hypothetical protein
VLFYRTQLDLGKNEKTNMIRIDKGNEQVDFSFQAVCAPDVINTARILQWNIIFRYKMQNATETKTTMQSKT